ncbi:SDR family oxidoreductase [Sphingobium sp. CR2-8]|uniref:SDR family oxidoreductase n=1 Tax=Sphingobium sp. CR2-8 TaxID=1306534 RepID=UPI002DB8A6EF|nr:SDR family oxidoreductase [Sphingobium sp. CR2-8]MEC3909540.1 SDR family oxidoreductase [Sphingobium sp. CR2-8]
MSHFVVTGAAGVLGDAVARFLIEQGNDVTGIDLSSQAPEFAGNFIGSVDLTSAEGAQAAADRILGSGPVNGLVNIAGGFRWETIGDGSPSSWEFLHKINVMTALHSSRSFLPSLISAKGAIVNVGAAATLKAGLGMGAYTASKSGVARLTEALAEELKEKGVRVNAVLPSIIDTPTNRSDMGEADVGKWVAPRELAQVIAFLLSDAASAVTGANIPVTGRL